MTSPETPLDVSRNDVLVLAVDEPPEEGEGSAVPPEEHPVIREAEFEFEERTDGPLEPSDEPRREAEEEVEDRTQGRVLEALELPGTEGRTGILETLLDIGTNTDDEDEEEGTQDRALPGIEELLMPEELEEQTETTFPWSDRPEEETGEDALPDLEEDSEMNSPTPPVEEDPSTFRNIESLLGDEAEEGEMGEEFEEDQDPIEEEEEDAPFGEDPPPIGKEGGGGEEVEVNRETLVDQAREFCDRHGIDLNSEAGQRVLEDVVEAELSLNQPQTGGGGQAEASGRWVPHGTSSQGKVRARHTGSGKVEYGDKARRLLEGGGGGGEDDDTGDDNVTDLDEADPWQMTKEDFMAEFSGQLPEDELEDVWESSVGHAMEAGMDVPEEVASQFEEEDPETEAGVEGVEGPGEGASIESVEPVDESILTDFDGSGRQQVTMLVAPEENRDELLTVKEQELYSEGAKGERWSPDMELGEDEQVSERVPHPDHVDDWVEQVEQEPDIQEVMDRMESMPTLKESGEVTHEESGETLQVVDEQGEWTPEWKATQAQVADDIWEEQMEKNEGKMVKAQEGESPQVFITAGKAGSGKTGFLEPYIDQMLGEERGAVSIDADDAKERREEWGYNGENAYRFHKDSKAVAEMNHERAREEQTHTIVSTTGRRKEKVERYIEEYKEAGYDVHVLHADTSTGFALWSDVDLMRRQREDSPDDRGRFVPLDVVKEAQNGHPTLNVNQLKEQVEAGQRDDIESIHRIDTEQHIEGDEEGAVIEVPPVLKETVWADEAAGGEEPPEQPEAPEEPEAEVTPNVSENDRDEETDPEEVPDHMDPDMWEQDLSPEEWDDAEEMGEFYKESVGWGDEGEED